MNVDVAIIGGGLAGNLLARQLRRELPALSVVIFERSTERSFKVGESTVEIASHYLTRRLGLNRHLYQNHLPKNGLRFFLDSQQRDGELDRLSEIGSESFPFYPSFQLDRRRLEQDLIELNRDDGVDIHLGAKVVAVDVSAAEALHRLEVEHDGSRIRVGARWLVDASGRARVLHRALGLATKPAGHDLAASWGRFEGVVDIDDRGPATWRERVRNTARHLSTIHFCYPGYWIWLIPLRDGLTSVGLVCERGLFAPLLRSPEGFAEFLREHRAVGTLLEGAAPIDIGSLGRLSYGAERFFDEHRWAAIGEAAAFSDPFYSPGSDFIALENDLVTDLIRRDVDGANAGDRREVTALYEEYMQFRFEATMRLYRGQYSLLGSYPLLRLKIDYDIASYYLLWFHSYVTDRHLDPSSLRYELKQKDFILTALNNFGTLFKDVERALRRRNHYFAENLDHVYTRPAHIALEGEVGRSLADKERLKRLGALFNRVRGEARTLMHGPEVRDADPLPLYEFLLQRSLA